MEEKQKEEIMETVYPKTYIKQVAEGKVSEVIDIGAKLKLTKEQVLLIFQEIIN